MDNAGVLRGLTIMRPPDAEQVQRKNLRARIYFCLCSFSFCLLPIVFGSIALTKAWRTGDWSNFWEDFPFSVALPSLSVVSPLLHFSARLQNAIQSRAKVLQVQLLRQAAAAGKDEVAPLAEDQPALYTPEELPLEAGPFTRLPDSTREWVIAVGAVVAGLGAIFGLICLFDVPSVWGEPPIGVRIVLGSISALLVVVGVPAISSREACQGTQPLDGCPAQAPCP